MKPAGLARFGRSQRSRATSSLEYSIEFSNLLDGIAAEPAPASIDALLSGPPLTDPDPDGSLADLVMFPVLPKLEPKPGPEPEDEVEREPEPVLEQVEEPANVSRFADTGIDDDLLPLPAAPRRRRR